MAPAGSETMIRTSDSTPGITMQHDDNKNDDDLDDDYREIIDRTDFEHAFKGGSFLDQKGKTITTRVVVIGVLNVPENAPIEVYDPRSEREDPPPGHTLDVEVPAGRYPIDLCLATGADGKVRVAAARVRISDKPIRGWFALEDAHRDKPTAVHDYATHTVDSGFSRFGARGAGPNVVAGDEVEKVKIAPGIDVFRYAREQVVTAFSTGIGSGNYPTWAGFIDGYMVDPGQIVIDYHVLCRTATEIVFLPLPFDRITFELSRYNIFRRLRVEPIVLGPHELRFNGDVARFWGGRLVNSQGAPISEGWDSHVSARPIAPTDNRPFAQLFQFNPDPRAKSLRLAVFDGQRALERA